MQEVIDGFVFVIFEALKSVFVIFFIFTITKSNKEFDFNIGDPFYLVRMLFVNFLLIFFSTFNVSMDKNTGGLLVVLKDTLWSSFLDIAFLFIFIIYFFILFYLYLTIKKRLFKNGKEIRTELHKKPF